MKFVSANLFPTPKPRPQVIEIANVVEAVQDSRIHIYKVNGPFLFRSWENAQSIPGEDEACG